MADLDELQQLDQEIREAEKAAIGNLAAHLREAVRDLPSASRMGLVFVQQAASIELLCGGTSPAQWVRLPLRRLADAEAAAELRERVNQLHDQLLEGSDLRRGLAAFGAYLERQGEF
jgi:hypothetical protein